MDSARTGDIPPADARVCFVSDTIHTFLGSGNETGVGGAERQQMMLAERLRDDGYPVTLVTLQYDSPENIVMNDIEVKRSIPDVRGARRAPYKLLKLWGVLRDVDADVYYVRGNDFLCVATGLFCRLHREHVFVYHVANDSNVEPGHLETYHPVWRRLYLSSIRSADAVAALTAHQREVLNTMHGIDSTVIPCGYDLPPSEDVLAHDEREYVLWVGRLDPDQKRPERFLDLAERVPEVRFVMIGARDNDEPEEYDRIATRAADIPNLEFEGFVPPDTVHEFFRRAALLVNTSDYEGFGNVFLEAWRYETPVVSLHFTLDGVIADQPVGIHAETFGGLVESIETLWGDADQRGHLGGNGRAYLEAHYSFATVYERYLSLFAETLEG